jgi:hypothetical protein
VLETVLSVAGFAVAAVLSLLVQACAPHVGV